MGYYATGFGTITFNKHLDTHEIEVVTGCVREFEFEFIFDGYRQDMDLSHDGKYYDDLLKEDLVRLFDTGLVASGDIEFCGEDDAHWRFHYTPTGFVEQNGRIVYDE